MSKTQGFTWVELFIALLVISFLAAIATPAYLNFLKRAAFGELVTAMQPYKVALEECYKKMAGQDDCVDGKHGIPPAIYNKGLIGSLSVISHGTIRVVPQAGNKQGLESDADYILQLVPSKVEGQPITWKSSGKAIQYRYVE